MKSATRTPLSARTIQHDGMAWRPKRGATATADEFIAARALFIKLYRDARWNPWVVDDRAADLEQAGDVMEQWTRAEPNFRPLTTKQFDARMARSSRAFRAEQAKIDARRERDRSHYGPDRERSRLELFEQQSRLKHDVAEATSLRNGKRFLGMADAKRAAEVAEADASIAERRAEIVRLTSLVGDPEDVVDKRGWLPQDRRETDAVHHPVVPLGGGSRAAHEDCRTR